MSIELQPSPAIRRALRAGDVEAIVELHRRVYAPEYGTNETFVAGVAGSLERAQARGWPEAGGGVWLVELDGRVVGSLGLIPETSELGRVRWFVLQSALRGRGLGALLIGQLVALARAQGMTELELETFSDLTVAARLYRAHGFRVVSETVRRDWRTDGRPMIYQRYVASLR